MTRNVKVHVLHLGREALGAYFAVCKIIHFKLYKLFIAELSSVDMRAM